MYVFHRFFFRFDVKSVTNLSFAISMDPGLQRYPKLLSELEQEFRRVVPPALLGHNDTFTDKISDAIRAFYFQQKPIENRNIDSLIDVSLQKRCWRFMELLQFHSYLQNFVINIDNPNFIKYTYLGIFNKNSNGLFRFKCLYDLVVCHINIIYLQCMCVCY